MTYAVKFLVIWLAVFVVLTHGDLSHRPAQGPAWQLSR
jgi:hypothetical protein